MPKQPTSYHYPITLGWGEKGGNFLLLAAGTTSGVGALVQCPMTKDLSQSHHIYDAWRFNYTVKRACMRGEKQCVVTSA